MNDRPGKHMNEEAIARGIRELPAAKADAAFRERLRSEFVSGALAEEDGGLVDVSPEPPRHRGVSRWWLLAPLAAATAALVLVALNPGPSLRVLETAGDGYVRLGGTPLLLTDRNRIDDDLAPGAELSLPQNATLDLVADGVVMYEVVGGTRMTVPKTPGRWFGREVAFSVEAGEVRMKTGPGYPGATVRVTTPDGLIVVTGTLLSIQCDDGGTCVCVLEGTARVGVDEADLEPVPPGKRKIMLKDGTVEIIPIKDMHRDGVLQFDSRVGHLLDEKFAR